MNLIYSREYITSVSDLKELAEKNKIRLFVTTIPRRNSIVVKTDKQHVEALRQILLDKFYTRFRIDVLPITLIDRISGKELFKLKEVFK